MISRSFYVSKIPWYYDRWTFSLYLNITVTSTEPELLFKIDVLKNFAILTGEHLFLRVVLIQLPTTLLKRTQTKLFSCKYCEIFKNSFLYRIVPVTTSLSIHVALALWCKSSVNVDMKDLSNCYHNVMIYFSKPDGNKALKLSKFQDMNTKARRFKEMEISLKSNTVAFKSDFNSKFHFWY